MNKLLNILAENGEKENLLESLEKLLKESLKEMVKDILEELANEERDIFLEEMAKEGKINRKNGFYTRNLLSHVGEIEGLKVPRDRNGLFHPFFIEPYDRNLFTISELVVSMYGGGLSTRDVTKTLESLLGKRYSPYWVTHITDKLKDAIDKWKNRKIESYFPFVYLDGLYLKTKRGGTVDGESFIVALGITEEGYREVLGFLNGSSGESPELYRELLIKLKERGLNEPMVFIADGLIGLEGVIKELFPESDFQSCLLHKIRNTLAHIRNRDREAVSMEIKNMVHEATKDQFLEAFYRFKKNWEHAYPNVIKSFENDLDALTTYFLYPDRIRRYIYTTNLLERFIKEVKRRTKVIEVFPDDTSAEKILYLVATEMNDKYAERRLIGFQDAKDELYKMKEERYRKTKFPKRELKDSLPEEITTEAHAV